ncbi:hypothetical protein SAMN04489713_10941 [Actinomadura madurae]|uniref:Uncharacterized protein n=1 Tax=Actinomadura madurae TaxID=1993 RepID=A0A1I5JL68_9ACTN|nr:hypothetical protein SAMN04489713_10941 [Actinomadura madurae]
MVASPVAGVPTWKPRRAARLMIACSVATRSASDGVEVAVAAVDEGLVQPGGLGVGGHTVAEHLDLAHSQPSRVEVSYRLVAVEDRLGGAGGSPGGEHEIDAQFERPVLDLAAVQVDLVKADAGVGEAGDAQGVQDGGGEVHRLGDLGFGVGRDRCRHQTRSALAEDAGGLAARVLLDDASGERDGVAGDAGQLHGLGIGGDRVVDDVEHIDGMIARDGVEDVAGGEPVEPGAVPAAGADPGVRCRCLLDGSGDDGGDLGGGGLAYVVGVDLRSLEAVVAGLEPESVEAQVAVVDAGQHRAAVGVDHLGTASREPVDVPIGPDGDDAAVLDRDRLATAAPAVHGQDLAIHDHEVRSAAYLHFVGVCRSGVARDGDARCGGHARGSREHAAAARLLLDREHLRILIGASGSCAPGSTRHGLVQRRTDGYRLYPNDLLAGTDGAAPVQNNAAPVKSPAGMDALSGWTGLWTQNAVPHRFSRVMSTSAGTTPSRHVTRSSSDPPRNSPRSSGSGTWATSTAACSRVTTSTSRRIHGSRPRTTTSQRIPDWSWGMCSRARYRSSRTAGRLR